MGTIDPKKFLPLKAIHHMILLLLEEGPTYGIDLLDRLEKLSGGTVRPNVGSLYRTIARLTDDGLIAPSRVGDETPESAPGAPRKNYEITRLGRSVLRAETARQTALLEYAGKIGLRKS